MKSMTGFANVEKKTKTHHLEIRLKSLNSRFLEVKVNLPPDFQEIEGEVRKKIQSQIRRGNVEVYIYRRPVGEKTYRVEAQSSLARESLKALRGIAREIGKKDSVRLEHLLQVVNPIHAHEIRSGGEKGKKEILNLLGNALKVHDRERIREGKSLVSEVRKLLATIKKELEKIKKVRVRVTEDLKEKYEQRIKTLSSHIDVDMLRLQQEIVLQIDRTDIHEEIVRLSEHIRSFTKFLAENNGKKLDFYTQELLRETNTIGSKAQVVEITSAIVNIKCHIERIRELVQNLE